MIEYTRDMNKNYIRISCDECENTVSYCMKMVEKNHIEGMIMPRTVDLNGRVSWLYEISGMISLEEKYADKFFSANDLSYISDFLGQIIINAKKYMLDLDGFILSPKYIVCTVGKGEWHLIYNITEKSSIRDGLKRLFEFILEHLDHKDGQAVVLGYALYKRVCREEIGIEELFKEVMDSKLVEDEKSQIEQVVTQREYSGVIPEVVEEEMEIGRDKLKLVLTGISVSCGIIALLICVFGVRPAVFNGNSLNVILMYVLVMLIFGGTAVLGGWLIFGKSEYFNVIISEIKKINYSVDRVEIRQQPERQQDIKTVPESRIGTYIESLDNDKDNSTILLSGMPCMKLIMRGKGGREAKEYELKDMPVTIGSGQADININEPGISRIHARISREGELLFIKDMNSTNGTWVNEHQLTIYELCIIKHGDIIKLADTCFELIDTLF